MSLHNLERLVLRFIFVDPSLVPADFELVPRLSSASDPKFALPPLDKPKMIPYGRKSTHPLLRNIHGAGLRIVHVISNRDDAKDSAYSTRFLFIRNQGGVPDELRERQIAAFRRFTEGATWEVKLAREHATSTMRGKYFQPEFSPALVHRKIRTEA